MLKMDNYIKILVIIGTVSPLTSGRSYGITQGEIQDRHVFLDYDTEKFIPRDWHYRESKGWEVPPSWRNMKYNFYQPHPHYRFEDSRFQGHKSSHSAKPYWNDYQPSFWVRKSDWTYPDSWDSWGRPIIWTTTTRRTPLPAARPQDRIQACMRTCPTTPEYNPVCGSNNVTYSNPGRLECARFCGVDVTLQRRAVCSSGGQMPIIWAPINNNNNPITTAGPIVPTFTTSTTSSTLAPIKPPTSTTTTTTTEKTVPPITPPRFPTPITNSPPEETSMFPSQPDNFEKTTESTLSSTMEMLTIPPDVLSSIFNKPVGGGSDSGTDTDSDTDAESGTQTDIDIRTRDDFNQKIIRISQESDK